MRKVLQKDNMLITIDAKENEGFFFANLFYDQTVVEVATVSYGDGLWIRN